MKVPLHSWTHSSCGYQPKTCTRLSQSTLQHEPQPSAKELLRVDDGSRSWDQFLVTVWILPVSYAPVDGLTHMYILKTLTELSWSLKKSTRSYERVAIGVVKGKSESENEKVHCIHVRNLKFQRYLAWELDKCLVSYIIIDSN